MLTYRWLGAAGLEFQLGGFTLLVDPFFTRPSKKALLTGARVQPDAGLAARHAPRADAVLITHAHYDHIMDVPAVMRHTGAHAFGSENSCALLALHGIASAQISCIHYGDVFEAGPFRVIVYPATHTRLPFSRLVNGPLSTRLQPGYHAAPRHQRFAWVFPRQRAVLPLNLWQYSMDSCFSFHIQAGQIRVMVGNHPVRCDFVFTAPYLSKAELERFLLSAQPQLVIPIHWDDFTRPLTELIRPMLVTTAQGLPSQFPPVGRIDLYRFEECVRSVLPDARVHVPELFKQEALVLT